MIVAGATVISRDKVVDAGGALANSTVPSARTLGVWRGHRVQVIVFRAFTWRTQMNETFFSQIKSDNGYLPRTSILSGTCWGCEIRHRSKECILKGCMTLSYVGDRRLVSRIWVKPQGPKQLQDHHA